jgi:hypothetical protein
LWIRSILRKFVPVFVLDSCVQVIGFIDVLRRDFSPFGQQRFPGARTGFTATRYAPQEDKASLAQRTDAGVCEKKDSLTPK